MRNVSERFKRIILEPCRQFAYKATVTLTDGTKMELDNRDFLETGIIITHETSVMGEFRVGNVNSARLELRLNNYEGRFTNVKLEGASIRLYIGLIVEQNHEKGLVPEWVLMGIYTIFQANMLASVITVDSYDNAVKLTRPYTESKLSYPATLAQILDDCCMCCGIVLGSRDFPNSGYVVDSRPDDSAISFRDMVAFVAQLAASFSHITPEGVLELHWYDTSNPVMEIRNVEDIWNEDLTFTGATVKSASTGELFTTGEEGYKLVFAENPLAQNNLEPVVAKMGERLNGFTFCPFSHHGVTNPALQAGDSVTVYDRKGRAHSSILMSTIYYMGKHETYRAEAKSTKNHEMAVYSQAQKVMAAAKDDANKKLSAYDVYAKQFAAMASASVGYYQTTETLDDGSTILYSHNKPLLKDSEIIWKKTGLVVAVSNDGGKTWKGLDKDGNAVLETLAAKTVIADEVRTDRISSSGNAGVAVILNDHEARIQTAEGKGLTIDQNGNAEFSGNLKAAGGTFSGNLRWTANGITGASITFKDEDLYINAYGIIYMHYIETDYIDVMKGGISVAEDSVSHLGKTTTWGDLTVKGNLLVEKSKTRVVSTSKGKVGVNAYETAEPLFGDMGEANTDENGKACITIDPLFAETVNTEEYPYQVFVQPYAEGYFWVSERAADHFTVNGPKNGAFAWEIKAKQRGYEEVRLEEKKIDSAKGYII